VTTIPAVLDALQALGIATLTSAQTIQGPTTSVTTTTGRIFVIAGEPIVISRDFDSMAVGTTQEDYLVPLVWSVDMPGTDMGAAIDAVTADYTAMELAIREYPGMDLGLSASGVLSAKLFGDAQLQPFAGDFGRSAAVRAALRVQAQNT